MTQELELRGLARKLVCAKAAEEQAKTARVLAEKTLTSLIPGPENGQKTVTLEDGVKITVKRGLKYKADIPAIKTVFQQVSKQVKQEVNPPIKIQTTQALDEKIYEWYRKQVPEIFKLISGHVTVTPMKASVTVKIPKSGVIDG